MSAPPPLLEVKGLRVEYQAGGDTGIALQDVSFTLHKEESLGVLGESGAGKSTLALSLAGLLPSQAKARAGQVVFEGRELLETPARELEKIRGRELAISFQDATAALNPLAKVKDLVTAGMRIHGLARGRTALQHAAQLLKDTGVPSPQDVLERFPYELSAGTRQMVMLAMALSAKPKLVILDQPCAALDPTTQTQVLEALRRLRRDHGLSYLAISHDLNVIRELSDRVAVMVRGQFVEVGSARRVFECPAHPYTQALLQSLPPKQATLPIEQRRLPTITAAPMASTEHSLLGCPIASRCSRRNYIESGDLILSTTSKGATAGDCLTLTPPLRAATDGDDEHQVRCHFRDEDLVNRSPSPTGADFTVLEDNSDGNE